MKVLLSSLLVVISSHGTTGGTGLIYYGYTVTLLGVNAKRKNCMDTQQEIVY
jgi:hypothetical protein